MYSQITNDIAQDYYQQNFQNDGQRFVAWYLRNIHLRDPIQTRDDITDVVDDKQIDTIFVDDDRATIFVVQGKFIGGTTVDARNGTDLFECCRGQVFDIKRSRFASGSLSMCKVSRGKESGVRTLSG